MHVAEGGLGEQWPLLVAVNICRTQQSSESAQRVKKYDEKAETTAVVAADRAPSYRARGGVETGAAATWCVCSPVSVGMVGSTHMAYSRCAARCVHYAAERS